MDVEDFTPKTRIKRAKFKHKILEEILNSEENYVRNLKLLTQYFVDPISQNSILNPKEIKTIFGEVRAILRTNEEFLRQLKAETDISSAFLKLLPYFKLYSSYSISYEAANIFIQNLLKTRPKFAEFINCQQTRPEVQTSLSSLLIQPIQRIPRYKLLLQELLKITDQNDNIKTALAQIETITKEINNQLRVGDIMRRMLAIQKMLVNDQPKIIVPGRHLIKEGSLQKISSSKRFLTRQFFLFNDMLMYCKQQKIAKNGRLWICRCVLPVRHCRVSPVGGDGNRQRFYFKVTCFDVELNLFSENYCNAKLWMDAISKTAMQFVENRKTLRKMSTIYDKIDDAPRNRRLLGLMSLSPNAPSQLQHSLACPLVKFCKV
uniref:DH domain-containing protein n=1 Tax=Strigamia maritima TaxID=126957 RepID=T1JE05_STRMM